MSNNQPIFSTFTPGEFVAARRDLAGDAGVAVGGAVTTVPGDLPNGTYLFTGEAAGTSLWEQDGGAFGVGLAAPTVLLAGERILLGADSAGDYLDGIVDGLHLWMGELSPLTQDFIWQTLNADGVDYSTDTRGIMSKPIWTDLTGDLSQSEIDRLNPLTGRPFRYVRVNLPPAPGLHRVQVAAAVNGIVLPDSALGGDLFTWEWIEVPGPPVIYPVEAGDVGWSAVRDFRLEREGHYTLGITRQDGGAVIVHFDVQVGP